MQSCKAQTFKLITPRASRYLQPATRKTNITLSRPYSVRSRNNNDKNNMSLFARNLYNDDDVSFAPFFRFIDAFDNHQSHKRGGKSSSIFRASFNPKFDVVETKEAYELHGEIPGAERKDISIEFTEPQTIVIHGRVERQRTEGTPPAGLVEGSGSDSTPAAITEGGEKGPASPSSESHRATVTDEETEAAKERGVTKSGAATDNDQKQQQASKPKYWFQERSVGEFHRSFSFPVPVDEEAVKASLTNGVLRVTVPKQEKRSNRRIDIA